MLIIALVLAVIGLAALVTAVVTSNAVVAWVCIGASVVGVVLLIVDAIRERQRGEVAGAEADDAEGAEPAGEAIDATYQNFDAEYPDDEPVTQVDAETQADAEEPAQAGAIAGDNEAELSSGGVESGGVESGEVGSAEAEAADTETAEPAGEPRPAS